MSGQTARYQIGDRVQWSSQADGVWKFKVGVVIAIVPAGTRAKIAGAGSQRRHESYVVRANGRRYWPRVGNLRLAEKPTLEVAG